MQNRAADVLVVAWSASQAVPEWLKILGTVVHEGRTVEEARARVSRDVHSSFKDHLQQLYGDSMPDGDASCKAAAACWLNYLTADSVPADANPKQGTVLRDFDVLSLCDTHAQWYTHIPGCARSLEENLRNFAKAYKRVLFLGVSMGGFGALSHAHIADTVVVFGPQTDLRRSHLRPGASGSSELHAAYTSLLVNVKAALFQGTRIEYHVAVDEHLSYARLLPLPTTSFVVHIIQARIARVLEAEGILSNLLIDMIGELQDDSCLRPWPESIGFANRPDNEAVPDVAWQWSDAQNLKCAIARWDLGGRMSRLLATPHELSVTIQSAPCCNDWFCQRCHSYNNSWDAVCTSCKVTGRQAWCGKSRATNPAVEISYMLEVLCQARSLLCCMSCVRRKPRLALLALR
eukprot:TRINITY_DN75868_c0_g1_i1.p1 TRINITY_DN75868_c0_g1~~TRINITY_DN75868_c0_g1_i1.p1  ORF type:complete len:404 (-),score=28.14 TRINITY_DN75868_c0_g1_i1:270-1481(-)